MSLASQILPCAGAPLHGDGIAAAGRVIAANLTSGALGAWSWRRPVATAFFPTGAARGVPLVEKLVHDIDEQLEHTIDAGVRARVMAIVSQCLTATLASPPPLGDLEDRLAVSYLKPSEVIDSGLVAMSQATLYRAVEDARFYCVTPRGKAIGKAFPAWQFAPPVPELLPTVLQQMKSLPNSEIHAFWVTPVDAFDDLTPAELLAGKPFATRTTLSAVQSSHLARAAKERQARVIAQLAGLPSRSSDLIG
uniref:hypothetical protein n=1 Tax=Cupriavidus taiwanensis TaxID=164546 RepID=UPI003F4990BB